MSTWPPPAPGHHRVQLPGLRHPVGGAAHLALLLALATRLCDYNQAVAAGQWAKASQFCLLDFPIVELEGKTLGLLGHGELGGAVARLAEAFGMRVLTGQIPGRPARADRLPLEELLPQVDALTLHCPLNEHTRT
jgi:glycerate dehydrogenase